MNDIMVLVLVIGAVLVLRRIILTIIAGGEDAARQRRIAASNRSAGMNEQKSLADRYIRSKQGNDHAEYK